MMKPAKGEGRARRLWKKSVGGGFVVAALLMGFGGASPTSAAIAGAAVAIAAGLVLTRLAESREGDSMAADPAPQEADAGPDTVVDAVFSDADGEAVQEEAAQEPVREPGADTAPDAVSEGDGGAPAPVSAGSIIKPTKSLPGQRELAERKGTWRYQGAGA